MTASPRSQSARGRTLRRVGVGVLGGFLLLLLCGVALLWSRQLPEAVVTTHAAPPAPVDTEGREVSRTEVAVEAELAPLAEEEPEPEPVRQALLEALVAASESGLGHLVRCPIPEGMGVPDARRFSQGGIEGGELLFLTNLEYGKELVYDGSLPPIPQPPAEAVALRKQLEAPYDPDQEGIEDEREALAKRYFGLVADLDPHRDRREEPIGQASWEPDGEGGFACVMATEADRVELVVRVIHRDGSPQENAFVSGVGRFGYPTDAHGQRTITAFAGKRFMVNANWRDETSRRERSFRQWSGFAEVVNPIDGQVVTVVLDRKSKGRFHSRRKVARMERRAANDLDERAEVLGEIGEREELSAEARDAADALTIRAEDDADEAYGYAEQAEEHARRAQELGLEGRDD